MEFGLTEEQRLLQQSLAGFLAAACPLDRVRAAADAGDTRPSDIWDGLRDLGIHGALIPEAYGGVGLSLLDAAIIAECLGAAAAPVPFTATAVMAPAALLAAGSEAQREAWLPRMAAGDAVVAVAVTEHVGAREGAGVEAVAGRLRGKAMFVLDGAAAQACIVADTAGALHLVLGEHVEATALPTIDRTRAVTALQFDDTPAEPLPGAAGQGEALQATIDAGRVALAADTLGAAQAMFDKAVEYAKERRQFNRVIGSFQAVKHLCAEMAAALEPCRALVWYAAHAQQAIPDEARAMACHAKAHLGEAGRFIARTATEVHGGMGFTDLLGLHYWFKRIGWNRQMLGAPELVRQEAAAAQGWVAAP